MKINGIQCDICGKPIRGIYLPSHRSCYLTYWVRERIRRDRLHGFAWPGKWRRRRVDVCEKCFDAFADFVKERIEQDAGENEVC